MRRAEHLGRRNRQWRDPLAAHLEDRRGARHTGVVVRDDRVLGTRARAMDTETVARYGGDYLADRDVYRRRRARAERLADRQHGDENAIRLDAGGRDDPGRGSASKRVHEAGGVEADERRIARNKDRSWSGCVAEHVEARRRNPRRVDVDGHAHALRRQRQRRRGSGRAHRVKSDAPPCTADARRDHVVAGDRAQGPRGGRLPVRPGRRDARIRRAVAASHGERHGAPATAWPDASVTVTTSPPGMVAPTTVVRLRSVTAARCAGGPFDGDIESPPQRQRDRGGRDQHQLPSHLHDQRIYRMDREATRAHSARTAAPTKRQSSAGAKVGECAGIPEPPDSRAPMRRKQPGIRSR